MRRTLVLLSVTAAALAGCGGQDGPARPDTADTRATASVPSETTETTTGVAGRELVLTTADSRFGEMLFDDTGQAIYLFDKEATSSAECYDACAEAWPPVLTPGSPLATGGVRPELMGTTQRTDGSTQVTYAGHPLYYYAHEGKNEVLCHNVTGFGGLWLVVTPSGEPAT